MIAKKITGSILAATLILGVGSLVSNSAYAAEPNAEGSITCAAIADDHENISTTDVSYPYGGTWQYGTTLWGGCGDVYSNFLHNSRPHHSSVLNADNVYAYSGVKDAGIWAYARTYAVCGKVDQSFYGFDD